MLEGVTTSNIVQYPIYRPQMSITPPKYALQHTSSEPVRPAQPPPPLLKKALVANIEASADANIKKRKRDASLASASEKRPRISVSTTSDLKRVAATRNDRSSTPIRGQQTPSSPFSLVERWRPIPRPCAITNADALPNAISCYDIVKENLNNFKEYFLNYQDPYDQSFKPHYMPYVELEYPSTGATERYALLSPKDEDAWHPVRELMETVYAIAKYYLPEERSNLLGDVDHSWLQEKEKKSPAKNKIPTPSPTPERERSPPLTSRPVKTESPHARSLLRRMEHAYAMQDGIAFQSVIRDINQRLLSLKNSDKGNALVKATEGWNGMPVELVVHLYEETYQRSAGPRVKELLKYQAFSSTTYGELNSGLIAEMCHRAGLKPGVNFLDLGSGIGNVVIQTALLSGCSSAGVEKLESTASIADEVHRVFKQRCALWGVESGPTEVFQGDFMVHTETLESKIKNADVILANNFVFDPALNEGLKALFLDLKPGAKVISLRSFCDGQMSRRNMGAIESILDVESFEWRSGDVSWGDAAGRYFISTVNRAKIESHYEKLVKEAVELGPAKGSRRRK